MADLIEVKKLIEHSVQNQSEKHRQVSRAYWNGNTGRIVVSALDGGDGLYEIHYRLDGEYEKQAVVEYGYTPSESDYQTARHGHKQSIQVLQDAVASMAGKFHREPPFDRDEMIETIRSMIEAGGEHAAEAIVSILEGNFGPQELEIVSKELEARLQEGFDDSLKP